MKPFSIAKYALMAVALSGCPTSSSVITYDLSVIPPGCRYPSACYSQGCNCNRGDLTGCVVCDPQTQSGGSCDCSQFAGSVCTQAAALCVGRGAACSGSGAKCVAAGAMCSTAGMAPEQVTIGADGSASTTARCKYSDDVCCPGAAVDAGTPDASGVDANPADLVANG